MQTDLAIAVSDLASDGVGVLFHHDVGRDYLIKRRRISPSLVEKLSGLGLSGICNVLAAIKTAKYLRLGENDVVLTVATDDSTMYGSEREKTLRRDFGGNFDVIAAGETYARHVLGAATDGMLELTQTDRRRIFNLGYFTWVEQQGVPLADFEARRQQKFWTGLRDLIPVWDGLIDEFNAHVRAS
jgi:hypothetical protein